MGFVAGTKAKSRGLKPGSVVRVDVRAEARTYLSGNGNGNGNGKDNDKGKGKGKGKGRSRFLRFAAE